MTARLGLRVLARNVVSNWAGLLVNSVVALLLTPFVLNQLGTARYGIWLLTVELTGYFGLLDFGFRPAVTMHLTRALAVGDQRKLNEVASSGMVALASAGLVIALATGAVAWAAPRVLHIDPGLQRDFGLCIVATGLAAAVQFPFFLAGSILVATQRFDLSNGVGIASRLVIAGMTIAALRQGYGVVGLSVITAAGNVAGYVTEWLIARSLVPFMRLRVAHASWSAARELASFSAWMGLISVAGQLLWYKDRLVIAAFLTIEAVTRYGLAQSVSRYYLVFLTVISQVFFPAATHLISLGASDQLKRMYLAASRFLLLCAGLAGAVGVVWAEPFFRRWLGAVNVEGGGLPSVPHLFYVLLAATFAVGLPGVGGQVMLGARRVRQLAQLALGEAITNLLLSLILIQYIGLWGVAVGTLVPAVVFRGFAITRAVASIVDVKTAAYYAGAGARPLLAVVTVVPVLLGIRHVVPADTWRALFLSGALAFAAAGAIGLMIGLSGEERRSLLRRAMASARTHAAPDTAGAGQDTGNG